MSVSPLLRSQAALLALAAFALSILLGSVVLGIGTTPLANAQSCTPVSSAQLHGHWKFDENTGTTTADSSGNGHTGTLVNGPTWSSGTTLISPNPSALSFDGTNDHVTVANSGPLAFGTGSFTVSLFARTGSGNRAVLGNFNGSNRGWGLYFYSSNQVNFFGYGNLGINDMGKSAPTLLNNQWHHVAGVYTHSGNSLKIDTYVDGTLMGTQTATVGNIASASPLLFGDYLGQPNYDGSLDDIRVYARTLSAAEINNLAAGCGNAGSSSSSSSSTSTSTGSSLSSTSSSSSTSSTLCTPVTVSGMSAYWKLDEASGSATDSTTFNNSGSLLNGATRTGSGAPVNFGNPRALVLDGTDDYVLVPNTTNLPSGNTARTVALWMKQDQINNQSALVSLGNGSGSGQKFVVMMGTSGGQTYLFTDGVNASNNVTLSGSQIPTTGTWHHVAFTFTGTGSWQYFLDGTLKKSGTFPIAINTITNDVELGARHDAATGYFDGMLDDIRIYNRVLTPAEIEDFAQGCGNIGQTSSSSSSISSGSSTSSSSSTSTGSQVPLCDGQTATIYVRNNKVVGGTNSGATFNGFLNGTSGNDVIVGTQNNDFIRGNQGNDLICGRAGNDFIMGDEGNDTIRGGDGSDIIYGNNGTDSLFGNAGLDRLFGGNGTDVLCGQLNSDYLQGQNGSDQLDGGANFDYLYGGNGSDTCANGESNNSCNSTVNSIAACSNNNQ